MARVDTCVKDAFVGITGIWIGFSERSSEGAVKMMGPGSSRIVTFVVLAARVCVCVWA